MSRLLTTWMITFKEDDIVSEAVVHYDPKGSYDDNVPLSISQRFAEAYRAAGGAVELELFPDMPHGFARNPGAASDRALELMKAFVARQLTGSQATV